MKVYDWWLAASSLEECDGVATRIKALADPVNLVLLSRIGARPDVIASDWAAVLGVSVQTVTHHVRQLYAAKVAEGVEGHGVKKPLRPKPEALIELRDAWLQLLGCRYNKKRKVVGVRTPAK